MYFQNESLHSITLLNTSLIKRKPYGLPTLKRDDIACNMIYDSNVNPGGNVPARAVRAIFARVYPSFVKGFGEFVIKKTLNEPILF